MSQWIESTFTSFDGLTLFYRYKKSVKPSNGALLFLHRGHEHSGRIVPFADALSKEEYACFAFDLRGHGQSDGERAWADSFDSWVRDLESFVQHLCEHHGVVQKDLLIVSNSVGSVMAMTWILQYGADIRGCILAAPAFSIKLYVPLALPSLRLASWFNNKLFVTSYVKPKLLTRDPIEAAAYDADPLITKKIGVNVLVSLFDASNTIFKRLADIEVPILLLTAEKDFIVNNTYHTRFIKDISSEIKRHIVLPNFRHAIFHDLEQEKVLMHSQVFIRECFQQETAYLPAIIPDERAHTRAEYQALKCPPTRFKKYYYTLYRWAFERFGKTSQGISIGLKYGFDSGRSLDYVYQNQPQGKYVVGQLIDWFYLNTTGWRMVRQRKIHLKSQLKKVLIKLEHENKTPVVFDLAAGAGRYLFEAQKEVDFPVILYLNDLAESALEQAQQNAREFGAQSAFTSAKNIFDPQQASWQFEHQPNIVVISGLFELYENNNAIQSVLSRVFSLLEPGGYLLYTGQPWHPQLELIARLLNNRNGEAWVMRRRIQLELDQLVDYAGFIKQTTLSDAKGIFTVSMAVKPS